MRYVSPFVKHESALSTIGNTLGLIENKIFPITQKRSFSGLESAQNKNGL
jgi:hypothetical protein